VPAAGAVQFPVVVVLADELDCVRHTLHEDTVLESAGESTPALGVEVNSVPSEVVVAAKLPIRKPLYDEVPVRCTWYFWPPTYDVTTAPVKSYSAIEYLVVSALKADVCGLVGASMHDVYPPV